MRLFGGRGSDALTTAIAQNTAYAVVAQVSTIAYNLVETFLLGRYLGVEAFGLYVLAISTSSLVFELLDFRTQEAAIRFIPRYLLANDDHRMGGFLKGLFLVTTITALFSTLIVLAAGHGVANYLYGDNRLGDLFPVTVAILLPPSIARPCGSILRVFDRPKIAATWGAVGNVLRIVVLLLAVIMEMSIQRIMLARAIGELMVMVLMIGLVHRELRARNISLVEGPLASIKGELKEIASFLAGTSISSSLKALGTRLDVMLVGAFCPLNQVGIYKIATRLASVVLLATDPLYVALFPEYAHLVAQKKFTAIRDFSLKVTKLAVVLALAAVLIFALFGEMFIERTLGPDYSAAYLPLMIASLGILAQSSFFWARPLLLSLGMAKHLTGAYAGALATQFLLLLLLLEHYQALAAAAALSAMYIMFVSLELAALKRFFESET